MIKLLKAKITAREATKAKLVSIPYGKGKVIEDNEQTYYAKLYQSPMGKVKNNILCCDFIIFHRYRFVKKFFQKSACFCLLILVINRYYLLS